MPGTLRRIVRRAAPSRAGRRDRGVSAIELLLYMPLVMFVIFVTVQAALFYLGSQVASSVAREASRVVRQGGTADQAQAVARDYASRTGMGIVSNVTISVSQPDPASVQATVRADSLHLVPVAWLEHVSASAAGPIDRFTTEPSAPGGTAP